MEIPLPAYENPPQWVPPNMRANNPNYENDINLFMPRLIYIKKEKMDEPGGTHSNPFIFVSKIYNDTIASQCGIHEGDQLISVNGIDFRIIDHYEAVKLLKESSEFLIVAKFSPYEYKRSFIEPSVN